MQTYLSDKMHLTEVIRKTVILWFFENTSFLRHFVPKACLFGFFKSAEKDGVFLYHHDIFMKKYFIVL
jgi:hypothetical protein